MRKPALAAADRVPIACSKAVPEARCRTSIDRSASGSNHLAELLLRTKCLTAEDEGDQANDEGHHWRQKRGPEPNVSLQEGRGYCSQSCNVNNPVWSASDEQEGGRKCKTYQ